MTARRKTAKTPPPSAVSSITGIIGALALLSAAALGILLELSAAPLLFLCLLLPAFLMGAWTLCVEKCYANPSAGFDFQSPHAAAVVLPMTITKIIGLGATLLILKILYKAFGYFDKDKFQIFHILFDVYIGTIAIFAPFYIYWTSKFMTEPKDGLWHFGKLVSLQWKSIEVEKTKEHCRSWVIKWFFLSFMISITPYWVVSIRDTDYAQILHDPLVLAQFLISLSFFIDVFIGSIGYIFTLRLLDSHIQSSNPHLSGWLAAAVCYPPFVLMHEQGVLYYKSGTQEWSHWLSDSWLFTPWAVLVSGLALIYAWATLAFGLRFSNLTWRGVLTNGPYRFCKHPAYLAKNLFWWVSVMPFLSLSGPGSAARNCLMLLCVNAIYYARARTEERHLLAADPSYALYSEWIAEHGLLARVLRALKKPLSRP